MRKIILGILVAVIIFGVVGSSFAREIGDPKQPKPATDDSNQM